MWYLALVVQAAVFFAWAFQMFRTLFRIRRQLVAREGRPFPGPGPTLEAYRDWLTNPVEAASRRRLTVLTVALFAMIAVTSTLRP